MEIFTLGGVPSSIRASATLWGNFGTDASTASTDITAIDSGDWIGDEGETYRGRIKSDLVPHLDKAAQAWGIVKTALHTYAGHLETLQSQMSALKTQHGHQQTVVNNARTSYSRAKSADKTHHDSRERAKDALTDGEKLPADTYHAQSGSASTALQTAQQDLQDLVTKAGAIRAEHTTFLNACCKEIKRAKDLRPVDPPGRMDRLKKYVSDTVKQGYEGFKKGVSWAAEHVAPALKIISAVAGLLALIPVLAPVMGPIALAAGAAALTIDVLNKLLNGKGSWLQIGIDTVGLIPGVKSLSSLGKMGKFATAARGTKMFTVAKGLKAMGNADKFWTGAEVFSTGGTVALNAFGAANGKPGYSWKDTAISALGLKVPGAGPKFQAVQGLVESGVKTTDDAVGIGTKIRNGQKITGGDVWKLTQDAAGGAIKTRNTVAYRHGGGPDNRHPSTGRFRAAYDNPKYDWPHSKQTIRNSSSHVSQSVRMGTASAALQLSLFMGPRGR